MRPLAPRPVSLSCAPPLTLTTAPRPLASNRTPRPPLQPRLGSSAASAAPRTATARSAWSLSPTAPARRRTLTRHPRHPVYLAPRWNSGPSPLMRALLPSNVLAPATRVCRRGRGRRRAQRRVRRGHAGRVLLQGARAGERSMRCAQEVHAAAHPMRRQSRDGQPGARVAFPHIPHLGCQGEWTPLAPGCDSIASRCPWATTSTATTRWLWT